MNRKKIVTWAIGLLLTGTSVSGLLGWQSANKRADSLEKQVAEYQKQAEQSAVDRSVSRQMEEIAYQQKEISDEQRVEAEQQTLLAQQMQHQSEVERQNALEAERKAVASEHQAHDAREVAEKQRLNAEHQRIQAEFSKRVADTLSYIALGRTLGSLSSIQTQSGNVDLAALLAYASYLFTNRYGGDVYYPAVFQSLMNASQSKRSWPVYNAPVSSIAMMPKGDDRIVTASTYGTLMTHKYHEGKLSSTTLLNNSQYDFRDIYIAPNADIYAISRSGHLAIISSGSPQVIALPTLPHPEALSELDSENLLIVGNQKMARFNVKTKSVTETRELGFKVTATSRYDNHPILFDDKGRQHLVKSMSDLQASKIPVSGVVTAFASSKNAHLKAYGMSDGTIWLIDEKTNTPTKLIGHLSRVSKLKLIGQRLYSSSYDGSVCLWNTVSDKIEPMPLLSSNAWILNFTFDNTKTSIWMGDQNGNVTGAMLSIPMMVETLSKKIKREFTHEEWNYYIGRNVPMESFMKKGGRP